MPRRPSGDRPRIELVCNGSGDALSHLYTGFGLLERAGRIDLHLRRAPGYDVRHDGSTSMRALVDGHRLAFDLVDSSRILPEERAWATTYFKRSYRTSEHGDDDGILPLGLDFPTYAPGDRRMTRAWWSMISARPKTAKDAALSTILLSRTLSKAFSQSSGCLHSNLETSEMDPHVSERPRIVMMTRLWDHTRVHDERAEQWQEMNEHRVACVRAVREAFGPDASSGLSPTPYAIERYPDCVLDPAESAKPAYIRTMRAADIGVATAGLRGSNGWRLGEYLGASKCIVTEPLLSEIPGGFADGTNYLSFVDADSCVAQCTLLMEDPDRRAAMMTANQRYYRAHARPDGEVAHALERVGIPLAP